MTMRRFRLIDFTVVLLLGLVAARADSAVRRVADEDGSDGQADRELVPFDEMALYRGSLFESGTPVDEANLNDPAGPSYQRYDKEGTTEEDSLYWNMLNQISFPTKSPTPKPSEIPTTNPSEVPSQIPTNRPSGTPSNSPSTKPSPSPSSSPSTSPTASPSAWPTTSPTSSPTPAPVAPATPAPIVPGIPVPPPVVPNFPEVQQIQQTIQNVARFGGQEFQDPSTYQSKALAWVMSQSLPASGIPLGLEEQAVQLYALGCIYYNTFAIRSAWTDFFFGSDVVIPGWFTARGWMQDPSDVCNWYGIGCDVEGRVSEIDLATNGLTGYFPPETALLHESLKKIDLYNNIVHNKGDLGNSFLGELTNLEYLYYGTTSFEYDGVPTEIGRLTNLKEYDFSYTLYFGDLRGEAFASLSNLSYLVMDGNAYNSRLPDELIALPSLEFLYAGFSFLEGDLEYIKDMPKIIELWVDDNPGMTATLPTSMGDSTTLVSFSAASCNLSGSIPTEIGQMTDMVQLWLYDNHLTGTIPTELGDLIKMKVLNLRKNALTGDMPTEVCGRRDPFGRLGALEADCASVINCDCCTCCGEQCISV